MLKLLKDLEVDSDAHTGEKRPSKDVVCGYIACMRELLEQLTKLSDFSHQENNEDTRSLHDVLKDVAPSVVIALSAHTGKHYWTNGESRRQAFSVLSMVLKLCQCVTMSELLVGGEERGPEPRSPYAALLSAEDDPEIKKRTQITSVVQWSIPIVQVLEEFLNPLPVRSKNHVLFRNGILKDILVILKTRLQRDTWKSHPNSKHALIWCLKQLKHPRVEPFIDNFFPPLLMLIDDHEAYHRSLGLSGMNHLIRNCDAAVLRWFGRSEVIYEAVKHLLYSNEVVVINSLHPCLFRLLPVLDGPPPVTVYLPRKPGKLDEAFDIFLGCMEMESKLAVRKAYSFHLSSYIELLGIFTVRYLKRVLSVISSYIEHSDYSGEETRLNSLNSLLVLMKYCWPRIPRHSQTILDALLKLISDLSPKGVVSDDPGVEKLFPLITECLEMLLLCHPDIKVAYHKVLQTKSAGQQASLEKECITQAMM